MKYSLLIAVLLISFSSVSHAAPSLGQAAPNFSLPGDDGKTYQLSELKGRTVVLEWFNDECPYVDKHYNEKFRNMQTLQEAWRQKYTKAGKELVWLAVVSSAPGKQGHVDAAAAKKIRAESRKAHMNAILLDPSGQVGKLYAAKTTPHMFIINAEGVLVYNGAIDDQSSARVSSLKGAQNYVSSALGELLAGKAITTANNTPYGCSVKY